jgi:hypothetical protein
MQKKILSKGYTVRVTSWENDGDNYSTKELFVGMDKDIALAVKHMCENLFISGHDDKTIGNKMTDEYDECEEIIHKYLECYPSLVEGLEEKGYIRCIMGHYNHALLGRSEWYYSRVVEKCEIFYCDEDVFVTVVE